MFQLLNRVDCCNLVRYRFKLVMLIAVFTTMVYLRISTGDEYFDRASVMCVAEKGLCDNQKVLSHTFIVDNFGNSICVERSTPCVTSSLPPIGNVTLSDVYLTEHVLDVKRQDIFPHSTAIIVLSFIGFCISFLFDEAPTAGIGNHSVNYSDAMRKWFLHKVGILVNLTNFAVILASAYTYKELFKETCNSLRNPQLCADLDSLNLVIWSVLDAENELMDNYQLCWMIIGVALLFGVIFGSHRRLFSFSRVVAPSSPRRRFDTPDFSGRSQSPLGDSNTYTGVINARAMAISDAAHRFIMDAAKPGFVYFLNPSKCCSICLGRLAVDFEISENEMDLLVQAARKKLGDAENCYAKEVLLGESDGLDWRQEDCEESDMASLEKGETKRDRKQSVSDIELCVAEFAHGHKSISEPSSGKEEIEIEAAATAAAAVAASGKYSPRSAEADNRLMDVASCVVELPCHHVFHLRCLRAWLDTKLWNASCPECRAPIVSEQPPQNDDFIA
jgi:hypothetical protein